MLVKKLWGLVGIWFGLYMVLTLVEVVGNSTPDLEAKVLLYMIAVGGFFALSLVPGFKGNSWRINNLEKRGFEIVDTLQAQTSDAAIAQFFQSSRRNPTLFAETASRGDAVSQDIQDDRWNRCTHCGTLVKAKAKVCHHCGAEMHPKDAVSQNNQNNSSFADPLSRPVTITQHIQYDRSNKCTYCGALVEAKMKFCHHCGNDMQTWEKS